MACIIKLPKSSKGVVTFTTQERDHILCDSHIRSRVIGLQSQWYIGLHHNWQPSPTNDYFDFNMTGKEDIAPTEPLIDMDACNFSPRHFTKTTKSDKHWDILYVTRSVNFKRVPAFLNTIRQLYDMGKNYRVLLICAISPEMDDNNRSPLNLLKTYEQLFSQNERERFTLLDLQYNYPFPLDLQTLAFFYKNSKVFTHFAINERRCRVACYAHACGMPLVSFPAQVTLLPEHLRKEPVCYTAQSDQQMAFQLIRAIEHFDWSPDYAQELNDVSQYFSYEGSKTLFLDKLRTFFAERNEPFIEEFLNLENLDRRLGRHHSISTGANKVDMSFESLLNSLETPQTLFEFVDEPDLEISLASKANLDT